MCFLASVQDKQKQSAKALQTGEPQQHLPRGYIGLRTTEQNCTEQSTKNIYKKSLIASKAPPEDQEAPGHPLSSPGLLGSALP